MNLDLNSTAPGSACKPLANGAACAGGAACSNGMCGGGGSALRAEEAPSAAAKAGEPGGSDRADAAKQQPHTSAAVQMAPGPPAVFRADIMSDARVSQVPPTFLATSHEWDRISDYANNIDAFGSIFKELGPSPILRMGGASQDFLVEPPPEEIW
jgi:hypothetical protein